jgi:hypothetical protein
MKKQRLAGARRRSMFRHHFPEQVKQFEKAAKPKPKPKPKQEKKP